MTKEKSCYGNRILDSVLCALATAEYFAVILPLQSYLANAESFSYGLRPLIGECVVCGLILFTLVSVLNYLCASKFGRVTHLAFLVAIVLVMLEAGPLSIGLPELNGEFEGYRSVGRAVLDYSVLAVALVLPWIFYKRIAPFITWVAIAVIVYSVATVCDVKRVETNEVEGIAPSCLVSRDVVVNSAEFSAKDNVIVLVLDATSQFVVQDIFRDSKLASRYEGFVNYVNNVGMHWNTSVGIPGLMTGKYYESALDLPRYGKSSYGKDSFAYGYIENDIPVFVNVGPGRYGCSNRAKSGEASLERTDGSLMSRPMYGLFTLSLAQLCLFRALPYHLKERFLQNFIRKQQNTQGNGSYVKWIYENNLYPYLAAKGVVKSLKRTLHVHHTESGHPPIKFDGEGKSIVCERPKYEDYRAQCRNALRCAANLFEVWKTNGIYDASTIIMAADHSASATFNTPGVDLRGADPHSFPFLMVKAKGARAPYCESELPTSHSKIAEMVRTLLDHDLDRKSMEEILYQDTRLVRLAQSGSIVDWRIAKDRTVNKTVRPDREPTASEICPLKPLCKYSFRIDMAASDYPDFVVENGDRNVTTGLAISRNPMTMRFRVPDPQKRYRFEFSSRSRATHAPTNDVEIVCGAVSRSVKANTYGLKSYEFAFDGVTPDEEGIVRFTVTCKDIGYANFVFHSMIVSESKGEAEKICTGRGQDRVNGL